MGTQKTFETKMNKVWRYLKIASEKQADLDRELLISEIIRECYCERRKAIEMINAVLPMFPYSYGKSEGKDVFMFKFSSVKTEPVVELTKEEETILNGI